MRAAGLLLPAVVLAVPLRHGVRGVQPEGGLQPEGPEGGLMVQLDRSADDAASSAARDEPMQGLFDAIDAKVRAVPHTRPLPECSKHDCSHRIQVNIGLTLLKILAVDQKKGSFRAAVWQKLTWTDYRLFYNTTDLHGFDWDSQHDFIPIEANTIWKPDVELLNQAEMPEQTEAPRAYLYDQQKAATAGYNIMLSIPTIFESKCELDMRLFPFDEQTCHLEFGTWSASTRFVSFDTLDHDRVATIKLPENNEEFQVKNLGVKTSKFSFKVTQDVEFPTVAYTVKLQRYPRYYIVNYILPLATLVVLSTATFWLDLRGGERQGFQITLLLSVFAVAYLAAEKLPESPRDTWLEEYQSWCLILAVLPAVESAVLDSIDRFSRDADAAGIKTAADAIVEERTGVFVQELTDACFRVGHPALILAGVLYLFILQPAVTQNWSMELAVVPLSVLLLFTTTAAALAGLWRFWKVDMPMLRRAK
jgi:hypothetical protein